MFNFRTLLNPAERVQEDGKAALVLINNGPGIWHLESSSNPSKRFWLLGPKAYETLPSGVQRNELTPAPKLRLSLDEVEDLNHAARSLVDAQLQSGAFRAEGSLVTRNGHIAWPVEST